MKNINDVYKWLNVGLQSGLLVPTILKFYWWRFNGAGFAGGVIAGSSAVVIQRLLFPEISETYLFLYSISIGGIGAVVGTYLTSPTEENVLERFYGKTLPMGFWKPLKSTLALNVKARAEREH